MSVFSELKTKEVVMSVVVLGLLFVLWNPLDLYMLSMGAMAVLGLLVVAMLMLAAFVWGDVVSAGDERELLLQARVGHITYLASALSLLGAIVYQSFLHTLDVWLIVTLGIMVLSKALGTAYARAHY